MLQQAYRAPVEALELLGDFHPLLEQLGSIEGLVTLNGAAASLHLREIGSLPALRAFLHNYEARILWRVELPAIQRAFFHASRGELRELIALDRQLADQPVIGNFAAPSHRVGRCQLQRLRPLRDDRIVQRYLAAVEAGEAHGWHTVVYGVTLAVYSLPLRQGLFGFAHEATRGFIHSAAGALRLSAGESQALIEEHSAPLHAIIESLLADGHPAAIGPGGSLVPVPG